MFPSAPLHDFDNVFSYFVSPALIIAQGLLSAFYTLPLSVSTLASWVDTRRHGGGMFSGTSALQLSGVLITTGAVRPGGAFRSSCCDFSFTSDGVPPWTSLHLGIPEFSLLSSRRPFPNLVFKALHLPMFDQLFLPLSFFTLLLQSRSLLILTP